MSKIEAIWYNIREFGMKEDKFRVRNRMVYVKSTGAEGGVLQAKTACRDAVKNLECLRNAKCNW